MAKGRPISAVVMRGLSIYDLLTIRGFRAKEVFFCFQHSLPQLLLLCWLSFTRPYLMGSGQRINEPILVCHVTSPERIKAS